MSILRDLGITIAVGGATLLLLELFSPAAPLQELPLGDVASSLNWPIIKVIGGVSALVLGACMAIQPPRLMAAVSERDERSSVQPGAQELRSVIPEHDQG